MASAKMASAENNNKRKNRRRHCHLFPRTAAGCGGFFRLVLSVSSVVLFGWRTIMATTAFSSSVFVKVTTRNGYYGYPQCRFRFDLPCSHRPCDDIMGTPEADLLPEESKQRIATYLAKAGIWNDDKPSSAQSSEGLIFLARDFVDRPEAFSSMLMTDFGFPVLVAHQTRALVMAAMNNNINNNNNNNIEDDGDVDTTKNNNSNGNSNDALVVSNDELRRNSVAGDDKANKFNNGAGDSDRDPSPTDDGSTVAASTSTNKIKKTYTDKEFRSTIVNERSKRRKRSVEDYNYGLPKDYAILYPRLASELDNYYTFMTQPSTYSQESPIRDATAKVYMNHARLFLGWCCQNAKTDGSGHNNKDEELEEESGFPNDDMSIFAVLPNKEKESADNIIQFILWMRTRDISVSYEANLLRGIIKLLKFRFSKESTSDPLDGKNNFDDIPIIKEVRKLHRDANQRQRLSPRSSDESKKWITWQDYLGVAQSTKNEVLELIRKYEALPPSKRRYAKGDTDRVHSLEQIQVAESYQRYLILAILSSIPDRQRTIRELEVGRTLIKDTDSGCWMVKHGPGDYKTGKHYGERPAMQLAEELTPAIDDFVERWRPSLKPSTEALLVQSKTGKPMTSNSVFKRVVRCCFKYTGKSVNPHLLRDIIVTHVRETEASEKELEALALYMGHSIQMQRSSYDRRTLSNKVAPAVQLMKSVNKIEGG
jgi:hypothetical protein